MARFPLAATAALFFTLPAFAQDDTYDARLTVAQDYIQASMADSDMAAFIRQMWIPVVQQMQNTGQPLSQIQISQIEKLYIDTLTEPLTNVMRQQDEVMADIMTLEELEALRDFYMSEHGRKVMQKMPQIAQRQQPMIAEMLRAITPQMLPDLQKIIQGS